MRRTRKQKNQPERSTEEMGQREDGREPGDEEMQMEEGHLSQAV